METVFLVEKDKAKCSCIFFILFFNNRKDCDSGTVRLLLGGQFDIFN